MLRGHVFKFQTFANEVFAHFINTFLQGNMGVTKGCELTNTNSSVSIGAGYFCIYGRFLEIVGSETIEDITNTGYYKLVCEIDLSKTNTKEQLNQAEIKVLRGQSAFPTLTQQNLDNGGSVYQYEFAQFKVTDNGIIEFTDTRTFLNFSSIYSQISAQFEELFDEKDDAADELLQEIQAELASIEDRSGLITTLGGTISGNLQVNGNLKSDSVKDVSGNSYVNITDIKEVQGTMTLSNGSGSVSVSYPTGFNKNNCIVIATSITGIYTATSFISCGGSHMLEARLTDSNVSLICNPIAGAGSNKSVTMKAYLLKIA